MKNIITFIFIAMLIVIITLSIGGCGYKGSLLIKENEIIAQSNKPMAITKTTDKDGNVTYSYSSKKDSGWMENLLTLIGLKAVNK